MKDGFLASERQNELQTDLDFSASRTVSSEDVTPEVLGGYIGRRLTKEIYDGFRARMDQIAKTCERQTQLKCSVSEISGATRFILRRGVELKDYRQVFAPPFAAGNC